MRKGINPRGSYKNNTIRGKKLLAHMRVAEFVILVAILYGCSFSIAASTHIDTQSLQPSLTQNENLLSVSNALIHNSSESQPPYLVALIGAYAVIVLLVGVVAKMIIGKRELIVSKQKLEEQYSELEEISAHLYVENVELIATQPKLRSQYTASLASSEKLIDSKATYGVPIEKYDKDGEIVGHEDIAPDMSAEKEQNATLKLKNSLLTALQEAYVHGILVVDEKRNILLFNTQLCEMWHLPTDLVFVGASGYDVYQYCIEQIHNFEKLTSRVYEISHSRELHLNSQFGLIDGRSFHCHTSPVIGEDGTYYGRIWEFRDNTEFISQQRELELAYTEILQKENQLTLALEGVGEGLWTWNTCVHVFTLNTEFAHRYHLLRETQFIYRFISAIHPDERERCLHILHEFRKSTSDTRIEFEFQLQSVQGMWRWIFARGSVLETDDAGSPALVTGTFVDITERKQYEKSMREASRKMLILSQITRHDILNQLSILFAMHDSLFDAISDPSTKHLLDIMDQALSTVQHQVEFTRDYQELGVNGAIWQDINLYIADTEKLYICQPIELISDKIPMIFADPLLEKAVYNIIENSLRHGVCTTEIRISFSVGGGNIGILTFSDNGVGVNAEDKEMIFESGFAKNTGLGLFLVREIVEITGMTIRECGTYGEGARFEITIPSGSWKW